MERLKAAAQERGVSLPPIALSAEVRLEKGLAEVEGLDALRYEGTRYILLELPFVPFKNWMTEEIDNIAYRFSLTPVLAHLDRYDWYSRDEVEELLERDDTVYQFNCSAFAEKKAAMKTALRLIKEERPVLLGSDAHSLDQAPAALCGDGEGPAFQAEGALRGLCPAQRRPAGGCLPLKKGERYRCRIP